MGAQEKIARLRELVRNAYNAIADKGGSVPEVGERTMSNLPAAIESVPSPSTEGWEGFTPRPTTPINMIDFMLGNSVGYLFSVEYKGTVLPPVSMSSSCFEKKLWLKEFKGNNITSNNYTTASWFNSSRNLVSVEVEKLTRISGHTFYGCTELRKVYAPSCIDLNSTSIFHNCPNLIDITTGSLKKGYANFATWAPTNALLTNSTSLVDDGENFTSNREKLLYNIREHIAANLQETETAASISFSAALKAAIDESPETIIAFTEKNWTIA